MTSPPRPNGGFDRAFLTFALFFAAALSTNSYAADRVLEVDLFVSPFCGVTIARLPRIVPQFEDEFEGRNLSRLHYRFVNMTATAEEQEALRDLTCARKQGNVLPLLLYLGNVRLNGKMPQTGKVITAAGLDRAAFKSCRLDTAALDEEILADRKLFDGYHLTGLPATAAGGTGFGVSPRYEVLSRWIRKLIEEKRAQ